MNNMKTGLKRALTNKNTVTILGVILAVIVLYVGYNWRVKSATNPISVPYAVKTISAGTEITEDMLTDEQKDDLECGLITMDDIRAELGGSVYGERIREYQFLKPAKGFTKGRQDTVYAEDDMVIKPLEEEVPEGTEDLFEDDDDEL